jgi:hypothetical protein
MIYVCAPIQNLMEHWMAVHGKVAITCLSRPVSSISCRLAVELQERKGLAHAATAVLLFAGHSMQTTAKQLATPNMKTGPSRGMQGCVGEGQRVHVNKA